MKQYRLTFGDDVFDVKILDDPHGETVRVEVNGKLLIVRVEDVSPQADVGVDNGSPAGGRVSLTSVPPILSPSKPVEPMMSGSGHTVAAPLPGVVKSITVRSGQHIAPDDELLVIEAMKMNNIIRATCMGTVGMIYVTEGRQVAYGEPLLAIIHANEN